MEISGDGDGGNIDTSEDNMEVENFVNRGPQTELLFNVWYHPGSSVQITGVESNGHGHFHLEEEHLLGNSSAKREADLLGLNWGGEDRDSHKWAKLSHGEDRYPAASSSTATLSYMDGNIPEEPGSLMLLSYDSIDNMPMRKPDVSDWETVMLDSQASNHEDGGHRMDLTEDLLHMVI